jgi:hypothetical protein
MWKSESALLIYLAVGGLHHGRRTAGGRPPSRRSATWHTSRLVPGCRPESLGALPVRLAAEVAIE